MALTFGDPYDFEIPLRTTWTEQVVFDDPDGNPISISGKKARGQLREVLSYDDMGNRIYGDSLLDLTTEGGSANIVIPADASGVMNITVPASIIEALSPDNLRLQVDYDIELYDTNGFVQPALAGTIEFTQRVTLVP